VRVAKRRLAHGQLHVEVRVKMVRKTLTIFTCISFYLVGNRNGKIRNGIRSVKSGPSKTDKFEQKYLSIDQ
jgi:hypothetical protein